MMDSVYYQFSEVAEIITGSTPSTKIAEYYGGRVPFVSPADLGVEKVITESKNYISEKGKEVSRLVPTNSVLLCCIGATIGKVGIAGTDLVTNQQINSLVFHKDKVNSEYGYYFCTTLKPLLNLKSHSTTLPIISKGRLGKFKIPLPPLETQKKIAAILDQADALIKNDKKILKKYDQLAQSVFLDMFGDPVTNPKGWEKVKIERFLLDVKNGITRRPKNKEDLSGEMILKLKHIRAMHVDYSCTNRIKLTAAEKEKFNVEIGDLLFIRVNGNPNYVGRCAVHTGTNEAVYYNDHIMRVRFKIDSFNAIFIGFLLNSDQGHSEILKKVKTSAGQYTINQQGLNELQIFRPELNLQNQFAETIEQIERQKQLTQQSLIKSEELFQSLLQRAFKGEFN